VRKAFLEALVELAERDERVMLLTGDLGYTVIEPFAERFPDRFLNVGVAEQNMAGVATGLADAGFVPFVYSIATFASMRPYEFVRNGALLHELPVRLVGVGGGFDYGANGVTHYALEDVALMRVQPDMTVLAPADGAQAGAAVAATAEVPAPVYFRLGKEEAPVPGLEGRFELGRPELVGDGDDVVILALGPVARQAVDAAASLRDAGMSACVAVVSTVNPPPADELAEILARASLALTAEAHYLEGGLGSLVAEVIAERGLDCRLVRAGVASMPRAQTGSPDYLLERHGLSSGALARAAMQALNLARD
jgi:transketolase